MKNSAFGRFQNVTKFRCSRITQLLSNDNDEYSVYVLHSSQTHWKYSLVYPIVCRIIKRWWRHLFQFFDAVPQNDLFLSIILSSVTGFSLWCSLNIDLVTHSFITKAWGPIFVLMNKVGAAFKQNNVFYWDYFNWMFFLNYITIRNNI